MPRFAEFFAGIGLVREAIEPLGWDCVFANDIAPPKAEMYSARFGSNHLNVGDIHDLTLADLPDDLDLLTASFPCIDLSLAGNRNGLAGRHSGTIWPFLNLVEEIGRYRVPPPLSCWRTSRVSCRLTVAVTSEQSVSGWACSAM